MKTKIQHQHPIDRLQSLPIPDARWDMVSVDFIVELPDSNGHNAIMVAVDLADKCAHIIPTTTTITALGAAQLDVQHGWKR